MARGSQDTGRGCRASKEELIFKKHGFWSMQQGLSKKEHSRLKPPYFYYPSEVGATPKGGALVRFELKKQFLMKLHHSGG